MERGVGRAHRVPRCMANHPSGQDQGDHDGDHGRAVADPRPVQCEVRDDESGETEPDERMHGPRRGAHRGRYDHRRATIELARCSVTGEEGLPRLDRGDGRPTRGERQDQQVVRARGQDDGPCRGHHWAAQELPPAEAFDRRVFPRPTDGRRPAGSASAGDDEYPPGGDAQRLKKPHGKSGCHDDSEQEPPRGIPVSTVIHRLPAKAQAHRDREGTLVVLTQDRLPALRRNPLRRVGHEGNDHDIAGTECGEADDHHRQDGRQHHAADGARASEPLERRVLVRAPGCGVGAHQASDHSPAEGGHDAQLREPARRRWSPAQTAARAMVAVFIHAE